jgi:hypothetical protein
LLFVSSAKAVSDHAFTAARSAAVLAKAFARAAHLLCVPEATLARVVGLSKIKLGRVLRGEDSLDSDSKADELAALLIRVFQSLDTLVGGEGQQRLLWMTTPNKALGGVPQQLIESVQGLVATLRYLEDACGPGNLCAAVLDVDALQSGNLTKSQQTWACKANRSSVTMVRGKQGFSWRF